MAETPSYNPEQDLITLSFATRLILSELDRERMMERSLESLADFAHSPRVGLCFLSPAGEALSAAAVMADNRFQRREASRPLAGSPCLEVVKTKRPGLYPLELWEDLPWPAAEPGQPGRVCLCAPLVAADNRVIGLVTFDLNQGLDLDAALTMPLTLLLTVVAVGLETARLFHLAVHDGLTGLYVRRFFELRLNEEETRIRRYGGRVALLMVDIDHFKKINDTFGHQAGDLVLREVAELLLKAVRQEVDVVCRYGGEEFVVVLPNTDLAGAWVVAERIRRRCQEHAFPGDPAPLQVTLSGGLAFMDQFGLVPAAELLRRADQSLYRAKEAGRNRIMLWGQEEETNAC